MNLKLKIIVFIVVCIFLFPQRVKAIHNFKERHLTNAENVVKLMVE